MSQEVKSVGNLNAVAATEEARPRLAWLEYLPLFLSVVGIGISAYLSWTHFTDVPIICTADHSCDVVNRSSYAYFPPNWGVPVAVLGLVGYVVILGLGIVRFRLVRQGGYSSGLNLALFIATLGGVIFSAYLTAMEIWVIHAICWWCVSSALTMLVLFVISTMRVWNGEPV